MVQKKLVGNWPVEEIRVVMKQLNNTFIKKTERNFVAIALRFS